MVYIKEKYNFAMFQRGSNIFQVCVWGGGGTNANF